MARVWLAWLCYWIGDAVSRPLHWGGDTWINAVTVNLCWRPYQKFMQWSHDLQGDDARGPWEDATSQEKG